MSCWGWRPRGERQGRRWEERRGEREGGRKGREEGRSLDSCSLLLRLLLPNPQSHMHSLPLTSPLLLPPLNLPSGAALHRHHAPRGGGGSFPVAPAHGPQGAGLPLSSFHQQDNHTGGKTEREQGRVVSLLHTCTCSRRDPFSAVHAFPHPRAYALHLHRRRHAESTHASDIPMLHTRSPSSSEGGPLTTKLAGFSEAPLLSLSPFRAPLA
jgi:hypothetical protein